MLIFSYIMLGILEDEEMLQFEAEADAGGGRHFGRRRGRVYRERVNLDFPVIEDFR